MPYIKAERKATIDGGFPVNDIVAGDLVYFFYKEMLKQWKANPCFQTAYQIKRFICNGNCYPIPNNLRTSENPTSPYTCMLMAYDEFKRQILDPYEDKKKEENGDVTV